MDGLVLTKDIWNLIIGELDSQADRSACAQTCFMFWKLVKEGTRKFVCMANANFCFKITKLRFFSFKPKTSERSLYVCISNRDHSSDVGVFPLYFTGMKETLYVYESFMTIPPFRFRTLAWKTFSFARNLSFITERTCCQCTDADLDCQMFGNGNLFVEKQ